MIAYFTAGFFSAVFMSLYIKKGKKKIFLFLSFLILFIISAFRYGIGYDYLAVYVPTFQKIVNGYTVSWDMGMILICKLIGIFSKEYIYLFIITSFIIIYYMIKGIINISDIPQLSILLFVITGAYMSSMNVVRQYMAIAIFVYSIKFIIDNNFKKYLLYMILAGMLHNSAFYLIPIFFINKLNITMRKQIIVGVILIAFLPIISQLFFSIVSKTKYAIYFNTSFNDFNPTYSELIISILLYISACFFYKNNKENKKFRIIYNLVYIFVIISCLSFKIILAYRLIMYFKIVQILMIPIIANNIKNAKIRLGFISLWILFYTIVTLVGGYALNWYDVEYKSYFLNGGGK